MSSSINCKKGKKIEGEKEENDIIKARLIKNVQIKGYNIIIALGINNNISIIILLNHKCYRYYGNE